MKASAKDSPTREPLSKRELESTKRKSITVLGIWGAGVAALSATGSLAKLPARVVAPLVVSGIVVPTVAYTRSPELKALARDIGVHRLSIFHTWRVIGTAAFLYYGSRGRLPPAFVRNAAWGDLATSIFAAALVVLPPRRSTYVALNLVGITDFLVAVITGLALTLRDDSRMRTIATFPLALIPLFGVGISGAAHFITLDLLREKNVLDRHA